MMRSGYVVRTFARVGRKTRYALVAAVAFIIGSATVASAAGAIPVGSLFYITMLGGVPSSPCNSSQDSLGKTTTSCNAVVDSNGNLHVSSQGTSTVSGTVAVNNLPSDQQVHGTVGINNFPSDQQIHGSVTVTNLPAVSGGGTIAIPLAPVTSVMNGETATWQGVDTSACRALSIAVLAGNDPRNTAPQVSPFAAVAGALSAGIPLDHHDQTRDNIMWEFLTEPGTNEPAFATSLNIFATNNDSKTQDLSGQVLCSR